MGRKVQTWYFSDVNNMEVWFLIKFNTNIIWVYGSGKVNERRKWFVLWNGYRPRGLREKGSRWHTVCCRYFYPRCDCDFRSNGAVFPTTVKITKLRR